MSATKFLFAKYIADLHRFEPRNIGIILWTSTGLEARFLGEYSDRPGDVDGRSIPAFVTSTSAYKQWVRYWRDAVSKPSFKPLEGGEQVSVSSETFLEALEKTGHGNFVLAQGGEILETVEGDDLGHLADQLFAQLVEANAPEEPRDVDLDAVCAKLFERTHLNRHKNFYTDYPVVCNVNNSVQEEYVFSHAFANGSLQRLYQRLPFPKSKGRLRKNVHDTAWSFEQVFKQRIVAPQNAGVLVYVTPEQAAQREIDTSLRVLASLTRVINLHDEGAAQQEFQLLADLPEH